MRNEDALACPALGLLIVRDRGREAGEFEFGMEVNSMTQWNCSGCGYTFEAETIPERCPSCKQTCSFSDVTCYTPDCGGTGNIDPRLMGKKESPLKKK